MAWDSAAGPDENESVAVHCQAPDALLAVIYSLSTEICWAGSLCCCCHWWAYNSQKPLVSSTISSRLERTEKAQGGQRDIQMSLGSSGVQTTTETLLISVHSEGGKQI